MIVYKGKEFQYFGYKGQDIESLWCKGEMIWPDNEITPEPEPEPEPDIEIGEIIYVIKTPNNNFELDLTQHLSAPNNQLADITIDWGDGSAISKCTLMPELYSEKFPALTHTYSNSKEYRVTITGNIKCNGQRVSSNSYRTSLQKSLINIELTSEGSAIVEVGDYAFYKCDLLESIPSKLFDRCTSTEFRNTFYTCYNLKSIPAGLFDNCTEATDFTSCFGVCNSLQSIPAGLFAKCTKVKIFEETFSSCELLQSIPAGLFDNCTEVDSFKGTFNLCRQIKSIPENLFDNCTKATNFQWVFTYIELPSIPTKIFAKCTKATNFAQAFLGWKYLQSIPEDLFKYNTEATTFGGTFQSCEALKTVPEKLFDNCKNITEFKWCFRGCYGLTKLPELWKKYPSAGHEGCFDDCEPASNFQAAVDAGWANRYS